MPPEIYSSQTFVHVVVDVLFLGTRYVTKYRTKVHTRFLTRFLTVITALVTRYWMNGKIVRVERVPTRIVVGAARAPPQGYVGPIKPKVMVEHTSTAP